MIKKRWMWIGLSLVAVLSLRIYYVQEMLAALIVFTILFMIVLVAVLAMFLFVRAGRPIMAWGIPYVGRLVRRGAGAVDGVITNPVWVRSVPYHLRKERLKLNEKYSIAYSRFAGARLNRIYRIVVRVGGEALTVGLSQQKTMSKRLGNWLTQRVNYPDLIHLKSRRPVRRRTRRR